MSDDQLEALKKAAQAATPQNLDSAEIVENPQTGEKFLECPCCGGEGSVELHADFCNYDGHALGVQFYGIGPEHLAAEAYFRAASPAAILALIERVERAESRIAELEAARIAYASEFPADAEGLPDVGNVHANIRAMKAKLDLLQFIPTTAAQMIEFIGPHFGSVSPVGDDGKLTGDLENVTFSLTVHDLLSAFEWSNLGPDEVAAAIAAKENTNG